MQRALAVCRWSKSLTLALALIAAFRPASAAEGERWTVSAITGDVRVVAAGQPPVNVQIQGILQAGSSIETGPTGSVTLASGETSIVAQHDSRLTVASPAPAGRTRIIQSGGTLLYSVEKRSTPHFEVNTPFLAAVVKGTSFAVTVSADGTHVRVDTGAVEVAAMRSGEVALLRAGLTASVSAQAGTRMLITPSDAAPSSSSSPSAPKAETESAPAAAEDERTAGNSESLTTTPSTASDPPAAQASSTGTSIVLRQTIGQTAVNISEVSRGFISDTGANASGFAYGKAGGTGTSGANARLDNSSSPRNALENGISSAGNGNNLPRARTFRPDTGNAGNAGNSGNAGNGNNGNGNGNAGNSNNGNGNGNAGNGNNGNGNGNGNGNAGNGNNGNGRGNR